MVDILIEDSKAYAEALQYMCLLEPEAAYPNVMKYARVLLEHCPKETTEVFISYFTGHYRPRKEVAEPEMAPVQIGYVHFPFHFSTF